MISSPTQKNGQDETSRNGVFPRFALEVEWSIGVVVPLTTCGLTKSKFNYYYKNLTKVKKKSLKFTDSLLVNVENFLI